MGTRRSSLGSVSGAVGRAAQAARRKGEAAVRALRRADKPSPAAEAELLPGDRASFDRRGANGPELSGAAQRARIPQAPAAVGDWLDPVSGALTPAQEFVSMLERGERAQTPVSGLLGRVLRGTDESEFLQLTPERQRKLVFVMAGDGLAKMTASTGTQRLVDIGYPADYVHRKVVEGKNQFKLVVFPETSKTVPATWDNVLVLMGELYPGCGERLARHAAELKQTPFAELQRRAGFDFDTIDRRGDMDPMFMTLERYLESPDTAANARAFLFFSGRLNALYSGDGFTYDEAGERGIREYVMANTELRSIEGHALIDLPIDG
jgi:hypothetical protein